jgi:hypothetical protein
MQKAPAILAGYWHLCAIEALRTDRKEENKPRREQATKKVESANLNVLIRRSVSLHWSELETQ